MIALRLPKSRTLDPRGTKKGVRSEELRDPNEKSGCEAYVSFVCAHNATP